MNRITSIKGELSALWCQHCGREIRDDEIKPGLFKCEICGRLLKYHPITYPAGTVFVWNERAEP